MFKPYKLELVFVYPRPEMVGQLLAQLNCELLSPNSALNQIAFDDKKINLIPVVRV